MVYRKYIFLLFILFSSGVSGQDMGFRITGEFRELPFVQFVSIFEAQNSKARFLYDESVTGSVSVTASFHDTPAGEALELIFSGRDIYWYFDSSGYIILQKSSGSGAFGMIISRIVALYLIPV